MDPAMNVTVPVGVPPVPLESVTTRIKLIACPYDDGFDDDFKLALVCKFVAGFTTCVSTPELAPKSALPAYRAASWWLATESEEVAKLANPFASSADVPSSSERSEERRVGKEW